MIIKINVMTWAISKTSGPLRPVVIKINNRINVNITNAMTNEYIVRMSMICIVFSSYN